MVRRKHEENPVEMNLQNCLNQKFFLFFIISITAIFIPFFVSVYFSLSLSAPAAVMSTTWTEWVLQIPMAAFLLSAAPLCLLEGIIHLALSLYAALSRVLTRRRQHTDTVCLHG